jgi:hypothetical protein
MPISGGEVIWGYRIIFGGDPESEDVIRPHMKCNGLMSSEKTPCPRS